MLTISIANILIPAGILLAVAAIFAVVLVILSQKLAVKRDPRVEEVLSHLPKANCGGCGYPGCEGFAAALCEGKASLSACNTTPRAEREAIAAVLGLTDAGGEETVAVVRCNGGTDCKDRYDYVGYGDCPSVQLLAGGRKACDFGCLGMGSCLRACDKQAISRNEKGIPEVKKDLCISCGHCIAACPRGLVGRVPKRAKVYVACRSTCPGKEVRAACKGGCIGCGLCAKNCPEGAISVVRNLAVIDYSKCVGCGICAEKCPSKCIRKL